MTEHDPAPAVTVVMPHYGVLEDLESVGYPVSSVAELRNSGVRYREAVPVLLRWLAKVATDSEREEIVRTLSVPWAKEALGPLISQFAAEPIPSSPQGELVRWAVGNALEVFGMIDSSTRWSGWRVIDGSGSLVRCLCWPWASPGARRLSVSWSSFSMTRTSTDTP